jgi:hypothetical protein
VAIETSFDAIDESKQLRVPQQQLSVTLDAADLGSRLVRGHVDPGDDVEENPQPCADGELLSDRVGRVVRLQSTFMKALLTASAAPSVCATALAAGAAFPGAYRVR